MVEAKTKKRKVSKKTKKSWRKHVDMQDVDKFLEDTRQEERLGSFSNRENADLFVISTKPEVLSKKARRELLQSKEPRCFNILKPQSSVLDPIAKRNRVRTKEERKNPILLKKEALMKAQGIVKLKDKLRLKNRDIAAKKRLLRPKRGEFKDDVWKEKTDNGINTKWMSPDTIRHTMIQFGVKKKRLPASLHKKPSVLPAIEVPHPGTSYNPSYEDHQNLLREVAGKEMELMKEEKHLERVTTKMFKKVSAAEKEKYFMNEMSEGLNLENENVIEDIDEDTDVKSVNPPVRNLKKTRVQRRKQKEQRALAHKIETEKIEKKKLSDIYKLRLLDKQLTKREKKQKMLREKRLKQKSLKVTETKVLGKVKFEPLEPDFKLLDELTGNLRNSTPAGNLLKDRFKSLQQRNIVAPSVIKLKRDKAKVKRYIKPDHKIDMTTMKV
ncbi:ribosome biogenesis protein NOP53 [Lasioglossum baleicum]|uniref:ribosome biogenesis protein NOP53 n=1 Tax=Lasioglossum baleicum TaxID=434251 RepID=UPI003FCD9C40